MAPRALAGMPRWAPRTQPRPTHVRPASPDTLSAFMGFIATLVHSTSHSRLAGRHSRSYRVPRRPPADPSGHGLCRHDHSHPHSYPLAAAESDPSSQRRYFHNYFVTHLPSSSLHPDPRLGLGPHHKLPRSASTPHTPDPGSRSLPAASPPVPRNLPSRDLTVVRIPLRSAKHHFGAHNSRGTRAYNEDENQAGTIDLPAFARRAPVSLSRSRRPSSSASSGDSSGSGEGSVADSASGDPQIFYFGVFDGHGGNECSAFLRDELHGYIEETAVQFGLGSSLRRGPHKPGSHSVGGSSPPPQQPEMKSAEEVQVMIKDDPAEGKRISSDGPEPVTADVPAALRLERELLAEYKDTVGGYFRRFKPPHFSLTGTTSVESTTDPSSPEATTAGSPPVTIESVLTYAFLRADLDFVTAQARKPDPDDAHVADFPVNRDEVLGAPHARHHHHHLAGGGDTIGGPSRFKGGSTATVALVSTPTPQPFWHPSAHSTLLVAHVGDSRALLCETATGLARPLSNDHHPSSPLEARRLRRFFAAGGSLATDSFGEERLAGLANSRAFGDLTSKRLGVSAEPELCRTDLGPAEYSFLVLASDGVSGTLSDQEIVDLVKDARTPEQGARDVVEYATEVSADGDNATCLVVRLGGWERRSEGGVGSLGTKEIRDVRRAEAQDPRRGRR